MSNYNNDSIKSLGVLGGVRAKPASIGLEGNNHTYLEILGNAIDENKAGYGSTIITRKFSNGMVMIRDFGRGVPMGINSDGEFAYKKVFDELWSGGKYDNNEENGGSYNYSLGTNGVGATGTNYTSDYFNAISIDENHNVKEITYIKGVQDGELKEYIDESLERGTIITWIPSKECFRGKGEIDNEFIINTLEDQAIVNGGLKLTFIDKEENETEYYYEDGISGFIDSIANEEFRLSQTLSLSSEFKGKDNEDDKDYKIKSDVYFTFNRESAFKRLYHNSSWLESGGTPDDIIKNSFVFSIDKYIKEKSMYDKKEKKISLEDVMDSLVIVMSTYSTISLFTDQTKKKIQSDFMKQSVTDWLRNQLEIYFIENPKEAELIAKQVLINKRSREKAEKTRTDIKKKLSGTVNNITNRIDGFVACKSKIPEKCEYYIVEGKSALGSTVQGRDKETQAIQAIRGKILNCLKAKTSEIMNNDVIISFIKALGCGCSLKNKKGQYYFEFDISKLNYDKIIICTDGDVDGFHIRTLLITCFKVVFPELIEQGKLFIVESPLFEIVDKQDNSYFAYNEREKQNILDELGSNVIAIQRSKGLGENTKEMMWQTTMNPETRRLIRVTMDNKYTQDETEEMFDMLLGDNAKGRAEYITNNMKHYIDEI